MRAINAICRSIEVVSGLLLGAVMLLVVASTLGRYALSNPIPDSFDIARLLIGACLFWGFAVVGLRGGHIQVDLLADLTGSFTVVFLLSCGVALLGAVSSSRLPSPRASRAVVLDAAGR